MIKETYLSVKKKVVPPEDVVFDISRFRKKKRDISPLAPSRQLLDDWNQGRTVWKDYVERYYQQLKESKEAGALIEEIVDLAVEEDVWLVCMEREYPCHRFLVKEIIERILVARGALGEVEDYSEYYRAFKNITRLEITAMRKAAMRPEPATKLDLRHLHQSYGRGGMGESSDDTR